MTHPLRIALLTTLALSLTSCGDAPPEPSPSPSPQAPSPQAKSPDQAPQKAADKKEPASLEADARALLDGFLAAGADHAALTAKLKPTADDIRAVYDEPLAAKLITMYEEAWKGALVVAPKPDQDEVLLTLSNSSELMGGSAALSDFPGGYKDVVSSMKADVPIARFKFVKKGETLGMAFDGLVYVNGHWVLMPKPWRAL